jgi:hypothetical protein
LRGPHGRGGVATKPGRWKPVNKKRRDDALERT